MSIVRLARLSAAVVSMGVLSSVSKAQLLTADTLSGYVPGQLAVNLLSGEGATQTFSGVDRVELVTFRFLTPFPATTATTVDFMLTEWSGAFGTGVLGGSLSSTLALPSSSSWNVDTAAYRFFDGTIDLSSFGPLNVSNTYGITLIGNADTGVIFLGSTPGSSYAEGAAFYDYTVTPGDPVSLTSGVLPVGFDIAFVASPVPEASSAAVLFAGMFVGGLMVRRRRCRPVGESVAAPVAQA